MHSQRGQVAKVSSATNDFMAWCCFPYHRCRARLSWGLIRGYVYLKPTERSEACGSEQPLLRQPDRLRPAFEARCDAHAGIEHAFASAGLGLAQTWRRRSAALSSATGTGRDHARFQSACKFTGRQFVGMARQLAAEYNLADVSAVVVRVSGNAFFGWMAGEIVQVGLEVRDWRKGGGRVSGLRGRLRFRRRRGRRFFSR